jgi:hypothetical protein
MGIIQSLRDLHMAEQTKALRRIAKAAQQQEAPKGKWQRLPDGTWGYPPEETADASAVQAAYERGWREGWAAGWQAAKEKGEA